jgi:hypothetical protein
MPELESQHTPLVVEAKPTSCGDTNGIEVSSAQRAERPGDVDEDRPVRGISVIPIPTREIARLRGTLRLDELPRHKPTIVFDTGRQHRDADDE